MSEVLKSSEVKKEIRKPTGVELPHIQEARQLKLASQRVQEVAQRQKNTQGDKKDKNKAFQDISDASFVDLGPGKPFNTGNPEKENFVESSEMKDKRAVEVARKGYQEQLKKTYETHLADLKDNPKEQEKLGSKYIEGCIRDLQIPVENPGEDDIKLLSETLPDVWKQTLLDPKSTEKHPELAKMRDVVLDRIADGAASIDRGDFPDDKSYEKALLDNFKDISGISVGKVGDIQTLFDALKKQKQEGKSTPQSEKILGTLQNTFGEQGGGNEGGFDDINGPVPDIGVCSENFPATPEALQSALSSIRGDEGVSESKNPGRIREYHAAAGQNAGPSTPWCMSFVQYMSRKYLGYSGPKTLSARDGLKMGNKTNTPEAGTIVVTRGAGPSGCHVGISVGNGEYISGNSGNAVKIKKIPSGSQFRSLRGNVA